jgi:hypothetical protein
MHNPYHSLYKDTVIPDTNAASATPRDVLYSYLLSLKVNDFKGPNKPLKRHKIPQSLAKQAMVSCLLRVAAKRVSEGGGMVEYDGGHVVEKGAAAAWFKSRDRHHLSLRLAPYRNSILLRIKGKERIVAAAPVEGVRCPSTSLQGFCRYLLMMMKRTPLCCCLDSTCRASSSIVAKDTTIFG